MGFLDRLLGREEPQAERTQQYPSAQQHPSAEQYPSAHGPAAAAPVPAQRSDDEIAVERYRYLLRTAPPETIERVHEEAFARLTPEQRRLVFQQLSADAPSGERPRGDDARSLAQAATRSELRQPGILERSLGGRAAGSTGFGGMFASSLLGSVAGYVIASTLVSAFLPNPAFDQTASGGGGTDAASGDDGSVGPGPTDNAGDAQAASADASGWDAGAGPNAGTGWDAASGWDAGSGAFGDFGGGDLGGGDFGGGDFGGFI